MKILACLFILGVTSWPMAKVYPSVNYITYTQGLNEGFCTTFSINPNGRYLTAAHCVHEIDGLTMGENKWKTVVTEVDEAKDYAVLTTGVGAKALKLGSKPKLGEATLGVGYAHDSPVPVLVDCLFNGEYTFPSMPPEWKSRSIFSRSFTGGMSGGPIVDKSGNVVSIVQASGGEGYSYIIGSGLDYDTLKGLYKKYGG